MAYTYDTVVTYDAYPSYTTFLPCCNAPVAVDGLYQQQYHQEVYYAPEPPPQIQFVRQRLPDPPPDVIERVVIVPQPKQYVYQVVEVPTKPPPVVKQRVVHQSPNPVLCGGTYRVQVPSNSSTQSPRLVQTSSTIQSPSNVRLAPNVQSSTSYMQQSPISYVQQSPSFVQQMPFTYSTSPTITY
jgi:hypothetical protein